MGLSDLDLVALQDKDAPVIIRYKTGLAYQLIWMWWQIQKLISLLETLRRYPSPFTNLVPTILQRIHPQMFWNVLSLKRIVKDYFYRASVHKKHKMNTWLKIVPIYPCMYPSIFDLHNFLILIKFGMCGCLQQVSWSLFIKLNSDVLSDLVNNGFYHIFTRHDIIYRMYQDL
jgi:hypothetical protein